MEYTLRQKAELIRQDCLALTTADPIAAARELMHRPYIAIHGPEHHILDGAAFLTALHNAGVSFSLPAALDTLISRGLLMPGASCGWWGVCHSASSVGAALAVLHGTGPLSGDEDYRNNLRLTSAALGSIAEVGGPRCCKRNAFLSLRAGAALVRQYYGITLPMGEIRCEFFPQNAQCTGGRCPFFPGKE